MKKSSLIKVFTINISILFLFNFIFFIDFSKAALNGGSLTIYENCEIICNTKKEDTLEEISSIEIPLGDSLWNVTNIELNFTEIKLEKELKTIEDQPINTETVYNKNTVKKNLALNVQLDIQEKMEIFGIYIYGFNTTSPDGITFQIQGYDNAEHKPNGTIYKSISLNISSTPGWYLQDFSSSPVSLPKANYSLVINGTEKLDFPADTTKYIAWSTNGAEQPITPNLYYGKYVDDWLTPEINTTLLHKIIQKFNKTYNPEELNMTINIDNENYEISDQFGPGGGNFSTECNFLLNNKYFRIEVSNNRSIKLNFTINYLISFRKILTPQYSMSISENFDNFYNVEYSINKSNFNYLDLFFDYTYYDLKNITIYEGFNNVTSPSILDEIEKEISISNTTIPEDISNWRIIGYSQKKNIDLDYPASLLTIERGQNIEFTVSAPQGNLTLIIINSNGFEKSREIIEHTGGDYDYIYLIPTNAHEGTWKAYTYWNNNTSAGVISQLFTVFVPFTIDPQVVINIIIIIGACSIIGGSSYKTVKVIKKRFDEKKKNLLNIFSDMLNIEYFMISEKKSGLNVYEQKLGTGKSEPLLITGFLDAISKFEIALTSSDVRSQTIKLEYKSSKIIMSEFKGFRITLIMRQTPSKYILNSIEKLSYEIDNKFGEVFENFDGQVKKFKGLGDLIERNFHISLVFPFKVAHLNIENLSKSERVILKRAIELLNTMEHFYIIFLIPENIWNHKDLKTIIKLIEKKIFVSIRAGDEGKKKLK